MVTSMILTIEPISFGNLLQRSSGNQVNNRAQLNPEPVNLPKTSPNLEDIL
jgi:hypothetical protein